MQIVQRERQARAAMLMTPAAFAAHVSKKEATRRMSEFAFLGVSEQAFDAQIAADEAFLAACPRREKGTRKKQ